MLRELFGWWIYQLSDCVPARWRRAAALGQDRLTIAPAGAIGSRLTAVSVSTWTKGRETELGQFCVTGRDLASLENPSRLPAVLRLSDNEVLCKTITLPLATERDLGQVLAFEMDRETPFVIDEVFWNYRIVKRDKQRGQLTVRLRLVNRAPLDPLLEALTETGILVRRAEIAGGADDALTLPLGTDSALPERRVGAQLLRWVNAAAFVCLAVLVVASPFIRQGWEIARLDTQIMAGRGAAAQAEQLRRDIERLEGAGDVIKTERAAAGDPLATLAALTAVLPDDTYLMELQQQQHKVTFGGKSAAASRLIAAVSKSNELRNPVFIAPVTRTEATHTEIFSISAEVVP
jgi:general secretion pathway protein L